LGIQSLSPTNDGQQAGPGAVWEDVEDTEQESLMPVKKQDLFDSYITLRLA